MNADEKKLIYNLLKTSDSYINGYTRTQFSSVPFFSNDLQPQGIEQQNQILETSSHTQENLSAQNNTFPPQNDNSSPTNNSQQIQLPSKSLTIDELNTKILRCTRCGLARTRNNVVPGQGVPNPQVLVVGEGPGYDEDMQGLPFVGKAGILLDKMLAAIQLDRKTNCYIANIVKCRPPNNRDPQTDEQSACISFLEAQIHILKPKMILCMGRISGQKLLNTEIPVGKLRGTFHDYNGIPLLVTYHPSALLRNEDLKRPAWEDLKMFRKRLDAILNEAK